MVGIRNGKKITARAQSEPTPLPFWGSVLTITPHFPDVIILSIPTCLCGSLCFDAENIMVSSDYAVSYLLPFKQSNGVGR